MNLNPNYLPKLRIEITVTDGCNCNCSYCFENSHCHIDRPEIEEHHLFLLKDICENLDFTKYSGIHISFWGGEPLLNYKYFLQIIETTYKYEYVDYHLYSNGTLFDKFQDFVKQPFINSIQNRFSIQLSYDGEPHHTLKRNSDKNIIFKTMDLLINNGFLNVSFKATLTKDLCHLLPQIWDSYYDLINIYPNIRYNVTLDTTDSTEDDTLFENWKIAIKLVAKKELQFFKQYGRFLSNLFAENAKKKCNINDSIFIHSDGNLYACHGCPYIATSEQFKLGNSKDIQSFNELKLINLPYQDNFDCLMCGATYCAVCHVNHIIKNFKSEWFINVSNNINKCKYYKYLGYIKKILVFTLFNER